MYGHLFDLGYHIRDYATDMRLNVYWQCGKHRLSLSIIDVNKTFILLLSEFERDTGIIIDPSSQTKLYPSQWKRLLLTAHVSGYKHPDLEHIQARFPKHTLDGIIFLEPD